MALSMRRRFRNPRNATLLALAAELPGAVLAELTRISISTAKPWSEWATWHWLPMPASAADDRRVSRTETY